MIKKSRRKFATCKENAEADEKRSYLGTGDVCIEAPVAVTSFLGCLPSAKSCLFWVNTKGINGTESSCTYYARVCNVSRKTAVYGQHALCLEDDYSTNSTYY
ncbi:hypothetical protein L596_007437 [Steinernema carpocapsae]|uniref:Uncharacterized protein n=1 Tax=Steinernema carpocapsae TaxID=34508 RepID=A0A4U5P9C6_STECR|nr:hypothetical protein L596_007437 [Steinernema carpocapsae]